MVITQSYLMLNDLTNGFTENKWYRDELIFMTDIRASFVQVKVMIVSMLGNSRLCLYCCNFFTSCSLVSIAMGNAACVILVKNRGACHSHAACRRCIFCHLRSFFHCCCRSFIYLYLCDLLVLVGFSYVGSAKWMTFT